MGITWEIVACILHSLGARDQQNIGCATAVTPVDQRVRIYDLRAHGLVLPTNTEDLGDQVPVDCQVLRLGRRRNAYNPA